MALRNIISISAFCLALLPLSAQPSIEFDQTARDMGTLLWHQSKSATFRVVNKGTTDLIIRDVHPDCGCTAADWTHTPIAPGGAGQIIVSYDAELLGRFYKQLAVFTNYDDLPTYITVLGDVTAALTDVSEEYPVQIGSYFLSADVVEFDDVRRGDTPTQILTVFNNSKQTYVPTLMHLPSYLTVQADPVSIRPGRVGRLLLTLDSEQLPVMGLTQASVYLSRFPGDRVSPESEISVSATLLPEETVANTALATAPQLELSTTSLQMKTEAGKKKTETITLTNTGRTDLVISALQVYNAGISVSIPGRTIKPGEMRKMKITVNPSLQAKGRFRILLITNEPLSPKHTIDLEVDE